jgi:cathepsin L
MVLIASLALAVALALSKESLAPPADPKTEKTTKEIEEHVKKLYAEVKRRKLTFEVGHTHVIAHPLHRVTGARVPPRIEELAIARHKVALQVLELQQEARLAYEKEKKVELPYSAIRRKLPQHNTAKQFDWTAFGKVTPVRDQGQCGCCWGFAACAAFESSFAIHNDLRLDISEQQILDCAGAGSCDGGWYDKVFEYMIKSGADRRADYSAYHAKSGSCSEKAKQHYHAVNWGYVDPHKETPSVEQLKKALLEHGPLAITVNVTHLFQAYHSGVFNEHDPGPINHAVLLVGWDDSKGAHGAWRIKNSWTTRWGEHGFMWIEYGCNKVGYRAAWVNARTVYHPMPRQFYELVKLIRPHHEPERFHHTPK